MVRKGRGLSGAASQLCWGFPVRPIVFRVGPVPQGRSFVASLRDGLRPPLTARPAPENRGQPGSPQKNGPGDKTPSGRRRGPGRARAPQIATRSCPTASAGLLGWV
ncbi:hypothetical protein E6U81_06355 [Streptomyces sp. A0592]|nr:hypothetical protein E6U81_06355 [Streptomyces sp. A0592]